MEHYPSIRLISNEVSSRVIKVLSYLCSKLRFYFVRYEFFLSL